MSCVCSRGTVVVVKCSHNYCSGGQMLLGNVRAMQCSEHFHVLNSAPRANPVASLIPRLHLRKWAESLACDQHQIRSGGQGSTLT